MKFLDALRGPKSVARNDQSFQDWISLFSQNVMQTPGEWPGYQMTYGKDPAEPIGNSFTGYVAGGLQSNGIVFALERKRLEIFSQVRFQYQRIRKGRPGDLFGDRALSILERPWVGGTTGDMLGRMILDADFAGNNWQAPLDGEVVRLRPDWVEIILRPRMLPLGPDGEDVQVGFKQIGIFYYEGGIYSGTKPAVFLAGEYSHFAPMPDPLATYRGMSWLTPVIRELQADTQATKHKLKFFENAATPNIAISLPKEITPAQFEAFVEKMDARHKGVDQAYETLYTGGGADVTVVGANMQQLDFKVTQGAGETRLAAAAGIHPVVVGFSEGMQGSSLNSGNYNAAKRATVDTTFRYLWQNAAGSLEALVPPTEVLQPPNEDVRLWYDARDIPFLAEDQKDIAEIQQMQASAWRQLVDGGMKPDAATAFIAGNDLSALVGQHAGLYSVQLQPPGENATGGGKPGPESPADPVARGVIEGDSDLDLASLALLTALNELSPTVGRAKAFNAAAHPRNPKGSPGGGRFRSMVDRIRDAVEAHAKGDGKGDPFDGFNREQLRKVAKARGIQLGRGEDRDSISQKLIDDLGIKPKQAKSPPPAAKKKVPRRPARPRPRLGPGAGATDRLAEIEADAHHVWVPAQKNRGFDHVLAQIADRQGFDAKPQVVSKKEMDRAVADGWTETWRGVSDADDDANTAAKISERLRSGDYEPGMGVYGNGIYVSQERQTAKVFSELRVREGRFGEISRIAISPDAKVADYDDILPEYEAYLKALPDGGEVPAFSALAENPDPELARSLVMADIGRWAAARGIDAIRVGTNHGDGAELMQDESFRKPQFVVLNRGILMIQEAAK